MPTYTLGSDGIFLRDAAPFLPVGVNYWPTSCVDDQDMWARWPGKEIQADLTKIVGQGVNAVRVTTPTIDAYRVYAAEFVRLGSALGLAVLVVGTDAFVQEGSLPGRGFQQVTFSARPGAHVLPHDGLLDPFFHRFLSFAVRWGRLKSPTLVASLGFGEPTGVRQRDAFLRAALPASRAAGAAAFFWRGWRDTPAFADGLFDASGAIKPGLEYYREFVTEHFARTTTPASADRIALLARREGDAAASSARRALLAQHLIGCIEHEATLLATPPPPSAVRRLLIPSAGLERPEIASLLTWVREGGTLFWHGPDLLSWSADLESLLGARPVDWRSGRGISVNAFGERFTFAHFPHDVRAELEPAGASVLARDQLGLPVLLENRVGQGHVRYMLPMVEEAVVPVAAHPAPRDRWAAWYRGMLDTSG